MAGQRAGEAMEVHPMAANAQRATSRSSGREKSYLGGKIVASTGTFDCVIRDRSPDGARLRILFDHGIPAQFHLIDLRAGRAHLARVAWAERPWMGVRFEQTWELQSACPPDLAHLRRLWLECGARVTEV
jgi:hypothetical protein